MSIDIHISNYEEFLYSYVDGELDEAASAALEAFMDAHPQVRQELELLLATRLTPEPVTFGAKASLYRGSEIGLHNYEPFLLNYIDGELSTAEAAAVEQFAAAHPVVQRELELWKATRLQPDTSIRFGDKAALYRHSAPVRRIRPAYWWGAAAAVVAGALFFILPAEQPARPDIAEVTLPSRPAEQTPAAAVPQDAPAGVPATDVAQTVPAGPAQGRDVTAPVRPAATAKSAGNNRLAAVQPAPPPRETAPPVADPAAAQPEPAAKVDLARVNTGAATAAATVPPVSDQLTKQPENEQVVAKNVPPSVQQAPEPALATAAPANPPGELIMSVTGNGIESKVLDKVTNVARLFSRKRNK